ncbi:MAG: methylenetetrahydrofolate reductase, partial [Thiohalophilus sp.]
MESQKQYTPEFSVEFFPPKSEEAAEKLRKVRKNLNKGMNPLYYSVTFGAGGSTQQGTFDTVVEIQKSGDDAAPHLSCIGTTKDGLRDLLQSYKENGIKRIVALRGDMPSGMRGPGELRYANELVEFIRQETGDHFSIEVAAYPEIHPQAPSASDDLKNFKRKVESGADSAITQYFYNADAYFRFIDECEGMNIDLPIIPGIMPITNYKQLSRFSEMCGADIPRWIRKRLEGF